ncbi:MAG: hypothetical protein WCR01_11380 [Bacteroidota bacterium]
MAKRDLHPDNKTFTSNSPILTLKYHLILAIFISTILILTGCAKYGQTGPVSPLINFPNIETTAVYNITQTTATSGGSIISQGEGIITAKGVCWDIVQNPTQFSSPHTDNGNGTGTFTSSITGLSPNTQYYLRAYATSDKGTGFGAQITFTTK